MSPQIGNGGPYLLGVKVDTKPEGSGWHARVIVPPGEHLVCMHIHITKAEAIECAREKVGQIARRNRVRVVWEEQRV